MRCLIVAALWVLVCARPALADTPDEKPDENALRARERYELGLTHYHVGKFADAIVEFKAAYELSKKPGLLFNIAQAYRLDHQWGQAAYFYRTYLRLVPDTPDREEVEGLIAEADREQAKVAAVIKPTPVTSEPPGESEWTAHRRRVRTVGWITGGGGALVVGIGIYFAKQASSADTELTKLADDGGTWSESYARRERDGRRDDVIGTSLLCTGAAAMVTGAAFVVWSLLGEEPPRMSVTPATGTGGVLWLSVPF